MDYFETQDIPLGRPLTYHDFFERFNEVSQSYHVRLSILGLVDIVDNETREMVAQLSSDLWIFFKLSAFNPDEMTLMTRLAATSPELRGGTAKT